MVRTFLGFVAPRGVGAGATTVETGAVAGAPRVTSTSEATLPAGVIWGVAPGVLPRWEGLLTLTTLHCGEAIGVREDLAAAALRVFAGEELKQA